MHNIYWIRLSNWNQWWHTYCAAINSKDSSKHSRYSIFYFIFFQVKCEIQNQNILSKRSNILCLSQEEVTVSDKRLDFSRPFSVSSQERIFHETSLIIIHLHLNPQKNFKVLTDKNIQTDIHILDNSERKGNSNTLSSKDS